MGRKIISARVDEEVVTWLDEQSEQRGISRGQLIEKSLQRVIAGTSPKEAS